MARFCDPRVALPRESRRLNRRSMPNAVSRDCHCIYITPACVPRLHLQLGDTRILLLFLFYIRTCRAYILTSRFNYIPPVFEGERNIQLYLLYYLWYLTCMSMFARVTRAAARGMDWTGQCRNYSKLFQTRGSSDSVRPQPINLTESALLNPALILVG